MRAVVAAFVALLTVLLTPAALLVACVWYFVTLPWQEVR